MEIKLHEISRSMFRGQPESLKPKIGEWIKVDDKDLKEHSYVITLGNQRFLVPDGAVEQVRDDERFNTLICGYCGKKFRSDNTDERYRLFERHCSDNELEACPEKGPYKPNCFWANYECTAVERTKENESADKQTYTEIIRNDFKLRCDYKCANDARCTHLSHRQMGPREYDKKECFGMALPCRPAVFELPEEGLKALHYRLLYNGSYHCYELVAPKGRHALFLFDYVGRQYWEFWQYAMYPMDWKRAGISQKVVDRTTQILTDIYDNLGNLDKIFEKYS